MSTTTAVSDLEVGDRFVIPATRIRPEREFIVHRLQPLPRSGRIRVWVHRPGARKTLVSPANYGALNPTDTVEKLED